MSEHANRPDLMLVSQKRLTPEGMRNLRQAIESTFTGPARAMVLEPGFAVYQLVEGRWISIEEPPPPPRSRLRRLAAAVRRKLTSLLLMARLSTPPKPRDAWPRAPLPFRPSPLEEIEL